MQETEASTSRSGFVDPYSATQEPSCYEVFGQEFSQDSSQSQYIELVWVKNCFKLLLSELNIMSCSAIYRLRVVNLPTRFSCRNGIKCITFQYIADLSGN